MPEQPKRGRTSEHLANLEALDKHLAETMPRSPAVSSLSGASLSQEDLRSLEKLKQEMGADFVGAEDWQNLLKVSAEGAFEPPVELINFLNQDCQFIDNKKIWQTHMVCFIPETIDGSTYSINKLAEMANALPPEDGQTRVVYEGWRLNDGASLYPSEPIAGGRYVLLPKEKIREFLRKKAAVQEDIFNKNPDKYANRGYEVGDAGAVSAALIMRYLKAVKGGAKPKKARLLNKVMYLRCKDEFTNSSGAACRAAVGLFDSNGLNVSCFHDVIANDNLSLAVLRNFKNT